MPPALQAVLFDHDGTLVDSEAAHFEMWAAVLQPYGIAFSEDQYKLHHAGVPTAANALDIARRFDLQVGAEVLADAKNAATRDFLSRRAFDLMPGVRDSIEFFRSRGLPLAVVTGAGRHGVDATLRAHALGDCFVSAVCGDDVRRSKPAPDGYLLAAERLAVNPAACVAFEDTAHGAAAAASAGMTCLAVPTRLSEQHDFSAAVGTFRDLRDATQWVANHFSLER